MEGGRWGCGGDGVWGYGRGKQVLFLSASQINDYIVSKLCPIVVKVYFVTSNISRGFHRSDPTWPTGLFRNM